jgi:hypothetical protein
LADVHTRDLEVHVDALASRAVRMFVGQRIEDNRAG